MEHAPDTHEAAQPEVTPEEARLLLERSGHIERRTTDAMPAVLISYAILCVLGTMTTLSLHVADRMVPDPDFNPQLAVIVFSLAWVAVAILVPVLFRRPFRRGLGARWIVYMVVWALLWIAAMIVAQSLVGFFLAPTFLVLFAVAAATEAAHFRRAGGAAR